MERPPAAEEVEEALAAILEQQRKKGHQLLWGALGNQEEDKIDGVYVVGDYWPDGDGHGHRPVSEVRLAE